MNNQLTVIASEENEINEFVFVRVFWMVGKQNKGIVDVKLPISCLHRKEKAEVIAIRYLLGDVEVLGPNKTGLGLKLVVSKGAIRKIAKQTTKKFELYEYGAPLITRYGEAKIEVSKDMAWIPTDEEIADLIVYELDGENLKGLEKISGLPMGTIAITFYALERYTEYRDTRDSARSWKSLISRLKGNLQIVDVPSRVKRHKVSTYGENPEIWKHPDDTMHYVFSEQKGMKVLVTVFNRLENNIPTYRTAEA